MNKETFRKTERMLYEYYHNIQEIERLENKCKILEDQREKIRQDIRETKVTIETEMNMGINYNAEKVQTSSSGTSYAEAETIRQVQKLEEEWKYTRKLILKVHAKIREVKKRNIDLEWYISNMATEYRFVAEMKYKDRLTLNEISQKCRMSISAVARSREKIVFYASRYTSKVVEM